MSSLFSYGIIAKRAMRSSTARVAWSAARCRQPPGTATRCLASALLDPWSFDSTCYACSMLRYDSLCRVRRSVRGGGRYAIGLCCVGELERG
eukprot:1178063-Prorocentrum_minimum.AAC.3